MLNLSETMERVLKVMITHGEKFIRYEGGFWSWEGVEIEKRGLPWNQYEIPAWHCDVRTLRALQARNVVELDEKKKVCVLREDAKEKKEIRNMIDRG